MANEVSFFHAVRKMAIENDIKKLERTIRLIKGSMDLWIDEEDPEEELENNKLLADYEDELKDKKAALAECEKDLEQAIAERK